MNGAGFDGGHHFDSGGQLEIFGRKARHDGGEGEA